MTTTAEAKRRQRLRPSYLALEKRRRDPKREAVATKRRKATPEGWAKATVIRLRHRAKCQGKKFNLTWEDVLPPRLCPVFKKPLLLNTGDKLGPYLASVDRLHNNQGYVKGNVRVISLRANMLKKDATLDELQRLVNWMRGECVSSRQ